MRDNLRKLDYKNSVSFLRRNASKALEKVLDTELLRTSNLSGSVEGDRSVAINNDLSQERMVDFLYLYASFLVPVIYRLEQNQFVLRKADPKDRRNNRIFITKNSESVINSIGSAILKLRKSVSKNISAHNIEITKKVLQKITKNADSFILEKPEKDEKKEGKNRK